MLRGVRRAVYVAALVLPAAVAHAQTVPTTRIELDDAVKRAIERNPTLAEAATNIARAEAALRQTRGSLLPNASANVQSTTLDGSRGFGGGVTQSQHQLALSADFSMPILAPSGWATLNQGRDQIGVATLTTADVRKQIAVSVAQSYLLVIAGHRQVEVEERALQVARAHLEYADKRFEGGAGSRLNQVRAAQEVSREESVLEIAQFFLKQAQEALGVLLVENGPVDSISDPMFDVPADPVAETEWRKSRTDIAAQQAVISAAERVVHDSKRDWYPNANVSFAPLYISPSNLFQPAGTWRLLFSVNQPIFDAGQRRATNALRTVTLDSSKLQMVAVETQARSEVRISREAVLSRQRALTSAQLSAAQANEVLRITVSAFQVGATTNLEVIDAQRAARDADSLATIAEDALRRAKLDLLVALGRFPR